MGRWNFLACDGSGSWADVPVAQRMPIFNRDQKAHWTPADYDVLRRRSDEHDRCEWVTVETLT